VPVVVNMLMKKVPGRYLHGYEAAYQAEKQKGKAEKERPSLFSGLFMLVKYPYVLGIFSIVFFYEVIDTVLSYLRLGVAQANGASLAEVSAFLFETALIAHVVGIIVSLFGTKVLLQKLGERVCLILVPLSIGALVLNFMINATPWSFKFLLASLKAIHYAFSQPVRESLYIPTIKEIKFKSKSWIDAFGNKLGRASGSAFNVISIRLGESLLMPALSFFFAGIIGVWFLSALLLGRRYDRAIANNEVIGMDEA
jgi:AAA family ATP:ADP antiporter